MKRALQTRITGRGQTAIPVMIQEAIGATPGRSLRWTIMDNGLCALSVIKESADGAKAALGFAKTFREARTTESWIKDLGGAL